MDDGEKILKKFLKAVNTLTELEGKLPGLSIKTDWENGSFIHVEFVKKEENHDHRT